MNTPNQSEPTCPVCSSADILPLCKSNEYDVLRCMTCACDFVWPMPDEKALKAYYDSKSYFQGDSKGSYSNYDLDTDGVLSLFSDFLLTIPNAAEKKILDIGCAFGTHLAIAAQQGWEAWGIELSSYARETALSRHGDKIHVVENTAGLPKLEFDLIVMLDVLEHLPNPYELFIDLFLHGAIGKKTQIIITTPNARSADAIADPAGWAYRHPPAHLIYFSAHSLKLLLSNLGCVDIAIQGIYASDIDVSDDYPDESHALNPTLKNCAGLMAVTQGFNSFLNEVQSVLHIESIDTAPSDKVTLYRKMFMMQKETAQKYALDLQKYAVEEDCLHEIIKAKDVELKKNEDEILKLQQSTWHRLGIELKTRPITIHNFFQILHLIARLIAPNQSQTKTILTSHILQSIKTKLHKLLLILWTLRNHNNRRKLLIMLREYWDVVTHQPALSDEPLVSPYNQEMLAKIDTKTLLVAHELSRTGAPYAVLYLARALFALQGVRPVIISPKDGSIRQDFEQEGFVTIVDPVLFSHQNYSSETCHFIANFEHVIVTSLASFNFIRGFRGIAKHLTWWIHETEVGFTSVANMTEDLPLLFAACESVWLGSPLCFPLALQYTSLNKSHLLLYGCPDNPLPHRPHTSGKIVFSIVGSLEPRKGQDIFLEAIERLPEMLRRKAIFRIIGSALPFDASIAFCKKLHEQAALIPEVECLESMSSDKLLEFYAETDVLVSASKDDPMPIVMTQGLMFSKVCLCSSAIGQASLLKDGKNGLIFTNKSAEELSEKMAWLIQNPTELTTIGMEGRKLYEKYFLMSSFIDNVGNLIPT
jgi:glycosyltransferase involved in cell wall biosynthesis